MLKPGDVILTKVQFTDTSEIKVRPAVVLFEDCGNVVLAGITSNQEMKGIPLTVKEGAVKDSVIKLNYIFTISEMMVQKVLFHLTTQRKKQVYEELVRELNFLKM
ncbi:MAG: type II toxin-antitoxin system PemK/MazF family toxin [Nanoarchaeota archaeon]